MDVEKKISVFPIPIVFYTPETGFGYGAGITSVIKTDNGNFTPRKSQITLGFARTTLKQTLLYIPFSYYIAKQKLYTTGELGYFDYTFRFFGFTNGVDADSSEFYRASFPRLRLNLYYQIEDGIFIGPKIAYDNFNFKNFDENGRLKNSVVPGSENHTVSLIGFGNIIDKRNNNLFPTSGYYSDVSWQISTNTNYNYYRLLTDFTYYFQLNENGVIATNFYTHNLIGNAQFTAYPTLGGTKKMRGYIEGAITNKSVSALQFEARQMFSGRFGAVTFFGLGSTADKIANIQLSTMQVAGGAGLRVRLTDKLNARIDYSIGLKQRSGFYITFGEAFWYKRRLKN